MSARLCLGIALLFAVVGVGTAFADNGGGNNYLALGDSVTFGYIANAGYEYLYPLNFVGYADYVGLASGTTVIDGGCPGETTSSFISSTGQDNGCRAYRAAFPLHVSYNGTQLAFATTYLQRHRGTRLVTVNLGANDGLLLEEQCNYDPTCIQNGAPQLFATVAANMNTILSALRGTGYRGTIVIANYYSTDYTNSFQTQLIAGLNQAITSSASTYGAQVADEFSAFQAVAQANPLAQGQTCVAGLLNNSNPAQNPPTCDEHPSQFGHKLFAQTILQTLHHH
jgi:lysophospholipase L1-like esterase